MSNISISHDQVSAELLRRAHLAVRAAAAAMTAEDPGRYSGEYAVRIDMQKADGKPEVFWFGTEGFDPAEALVSPFMDPAEYVTPEDWMVAGLAAVASARRYRPPDPTGT